MPVYQRTLATRAASSYSNIDQVAAWTMVHDALIALGLVQTEDTGQWGSMSGSTSASGTPFMRGYRVYQMTDTLGDLFLRVEFWVGFNCLAGISVTVGHATDGAGNITGGVTAAAGNLASGWSVFSATANYINTTGTFCAVRGDGFLFVSLADGGISTYPSGDAGSRYPHTGMGTSGSFGWLAVGRQTDEAGALIADRLVAVGGGQPSGVVTTTGNQGLAFTSSAAGQSHMQSVRAGQAVRVSTHSAGLVCADTAMFRQGNPVMGRIYADYADTGPLPLRWLGALPTPAAQPFDVIELALVGSTPKKYLHACASGYPAFTIFITGTTYGSGRYLAPAIETDGVMV